MQQKGVYPGLSKQKRSLEAKIRLKLGEFDILDKVGVKLRATKPKDPVLSEGAFLNNSRLLK